MEMDASLYDKCARENIDKARIHDAERETAEIKWAALIAAASTKGVMLSLA